MGMLYVVVFNELFGFPPTDRTVGEIDALIVATSLKIHSRVGYFVRSNLGYNQSRMPFCAFP